MHSEAHTRTFRAVIFDYGQVLCRAPAPEFLQSMASILGVTPQSFPALYGSKRRPYDRGVIGPDAYWLSLAAEGGNSIAGRDIERLRQLDIEMWSDVRHDMLDWAAALRAAGVKTAILSNMQRDMAHHVRTNFAWAEDFDCLALSAELKMVKPDSAIYLHTLNSLDVQPHQALFLDDHEANVRGAEAVGIHGILMNSTAQLKQELQAIDFSPLPELA